MFTTENIDRAYIIVAKIVRDCGDKYLPVFERMHAIREEFNSKQDLKSIALQIAQDKLVL